MTHRPVTAEIRASGYSSTTGGFTVVWINKVKHHPHDVARTVESHADMLAALKLCLRFLNEAPRFVFREHIGKRPGDLDHTCDSYKLATMVEGLIARAEGKL